MCSKLSALSATNDRLQLSTEWLSPTDVRICAAGQIDMSTADAFTEHVFRRAGNCRTLIIDLREVTFFDAAGFAALCHIDDRCASAGVSWSILAAPMVARVLSLCDPRGSLPMAAADCAA